MIRCQRPGACYRPGRRARPSCQSRLIWKRLLFSLLFVVLLNSSPFLPWMRRNLPPISSASAAAPAQQQASIDCAMYIYADPQQEPTKMIDQTSCPTGGGNRAFLVDKGSKARSFPKLLEVAPLSDHTFLCKSKRPCNLVVTGYGLEQGDRLILLQTHDSSSPASCPPEQLAAHEQQQRQKQVQATRHIRTSSKMAYDHSIRPQNEQTIMAVFELGHPEEGNYVVCYSTSRSTPKGVPQLKDFHYKAGTLGKSNVDLGVALSVAVFGL